MLRDKNIAIMFEKENINTLDMNGEMLLTILSSLAQEEVESLSSNVKMGLQMKMKRGELVGFNGCFGYDYHQDTKTITVNETEAETVRLIYDMYLQGNGCGTITKRLVELGIKNKRGTVEWHRKIIIDREPSRNLLFRGADDMKKSLRQMLWY